MFLIGYKERNRVLLLDIRKKAVCCDWIEGRKQCAVDWIEGRKQCVVTG